MRSNWSDKEQQEFRNFLKNIPVGGYTDENRLLELFNEPPIQLDLFWNSKPLINYESKSNTKGKENSKETQI